MRNNSAARTTATTNCERGKPPRQREIDGRKDLNVARHPARKGPEGETPRLAALGPCNCPPDRPAQ
eukprot:10553132-Lingulodinium_polyedra.AAC.1